MLVRNKRTLAMLAFMTLSMAGSGCLIDSNCQVDDDCPNPWEQCDLVTGDCFLECSEEDPDACTEDRPVCLLEEYRCVECMAGEVAACVGDRPLCLVGEYRCVECLDDWHCQDGEECISNACGGNPPALPLVLYDYNPLSSTYGSQVDLADLQGQLVMIFFAGLS